jgi:DNA-binding response OmpR family regulator
MTDPCGHHISVLWIEKDLTSAETAVHCLRNAGIHATLTTNGLEGSRFAVSGAYSLILLDSRLADLSGAALAKCLKGAGVETPVAHVIDAGSVRCAVEAIRSGAVEVLERPIIGEHLLALIRRVASRSVGEASRSPEGEFLRKLSDLVLSQPRLSVVGVAHSLRSERHFLERLVRNETGVSFRQWRRKVLIDYAAGLIGYSDAAMKAIGFELGYETATGFSRAFKAVMGTTPAKHRRETNPTRVGCGRAVVRTAPDVRQ